MKFAVDRSLKGRRYETDPMGPSLKRVLRYWTVRNKFEEARIHPDLAADGVTNIEVQDRGLVFEKQEKRANILKRLLKDDCAVRDAKRFK